VASDPDGRTQVFAAPVAAAGATVALPPGTGPVGPMPPLHAPDGDDDHWGPDEPGADDRSRRRRWLWLAGALALVLLVAAAALFLVDGDGTEGNTARTSTPATSASATDGVLLAAGDYVGRDAVEVQRELEQLGYEDVDRRPADEGALASAGIALEEGAVARIQPADRVVPFDEEVVLFFAEEAYDPGGGEPEVTEEPTEEPEPTPTPTPTATPTGTSGATTSGGPTGTTAATTGTLPGTTASETSAADGGGDGGGGGEPAGAAGPEVAP
jgi:serine/threonine-protein kinase